MNKIFLIDDNAHKGWAEVFNIILTDIYKDMITFESLDFKTDQDIIDCYNNNPGALFIQDNQLHGVMGVTLTGIELIERYGKSHCIILHTADRGNVGFLAAKHGAKMFMMKDIPHPDMTMSNKEMRDQIITFHQVIIKHFKFIPELMWLVYMKMGIME